MASGAVAKGAGLAAKAAWPLVKKGALALALAYAQNETVQRYVHDLSGKFGDAMKAKTPEARIRKSLEAVRSHAQRLLDAHDAGDSSVDDTQAKVWLKRADQIESALAVATNEAKASRKEHVKQIDAMAATLSNDVIASLVELGDSEPGQP